MIKRGQQKYFSIKDVALIWGQPVTSIRDRIQRGVIAARKCPELGKGWYIDRQELERIDAKSEHKREIILG